MDPLQTEAEWLAGEHPEPMLAVLGQCLSGRKLRLFGVACCRRIEYLLSSSGPHVVEIAERFADGKASEPERKNAENLIMQDYRGRDDAEKFNFQAWEASWHVIRPETRQFGWAWMHAGIATEDCDLEYCTQGQLVRDIFENPFRKVKVDGVRLIANAVSRLAETIYADRDFDRLPILADALEEAGCTDAEILNHCRGPGPHVRGCWVVDLLLGKE
jgi:hypothetical protein